MTGMVKLDWSASHQLPDEREAELESLRAIHSVEAAQLRDHPNPTEEDLAMWRHVPLVEHPLVWTHHDGRKLLLLGATMDCIVGMSKEESEALREELTDWCIQPQFVYSHEWELGDLLIWYNTATMHHAVAYTGAERRLMHRVTVTGEEEIH